MTQQELDALLVEVDMPRAARVELYETGEAKFSIMFANPETPEQIAQMFGFVLNNPTVEAIRSLPAMARKTIDGQAQNGLVPYYSIASNRAAA